MSFEPVLATTSGGELCGRSSDGVREFLGVPYAAAPVGALRWAPPAPPPAWGGTLEATEAAPPAPQPDRPLGHRSHGELPPSSEDCLRLNIYAPKAREGAALPVFVWLHGGGWVLGSPSAPIFDGASLARALDAVVVMVTYRLGSLGWLHNSALAAAPGEPAGNWGLLDQIAALRWTRANAAAFGGDPDRIVLAGESAGAASVIHLLGAPSAAGLVQRAIAMSPPLGESTISVELAQRWSEALAATLGARLGDESLREIDAADVIAAHERLITEEPFRGTRGGSLPTLDGGEIPADPVAVPGVQPQIDVLVGTNADEATFFYRQPDRVVEPDDDTLAAMVARLPGVGCAAESAIRARRAAGSLENNEILVAIATDAVFAGPVERWAAARSLAGGRVHRYRLEHRSPQPGLGAVHTIGVPLLFATHRSSIPGAWVAGDDERADQVSDAVRAAWRGFVHDGDPGWAPIAVGDGEDELGVFGGAGDGLRVTTA
ncbi:MAG TPA: carboxylesterase family protein [Solirubrobacteraceae bacterium]